MNHLTDFFFYWTSWGACWTTVTEILTFKAMGPEKEYYRTPAAIMNQISMGFNVPITILFWVALAPGIYENIDWSKPLDLWMAAHMFTLHVFPFVTTTLTIATSDIVLLSKDWPHQVMGVMAYSLANACGQFYMGHPVYPTAPWDWEKPVSTIFWFACLAALQTGLYLLTCYLNKMFNTWAKSE